MKPLLRQIVARLLERQVRRVIATHHVKVVAVAGSVGKTSTKAAIATVLKQKYKTLGQTGGYNSEIGLPLAVFELLVPNNLVSPIAWHRLLRQTDQIIKNYPYEVLVLELGTDHPGEIARFMRYLNPDIGVLTAISPEHMENFPGGLDQVAAEEMTLARGSKTLAVNDETVPGRYQKEYLADHARVLYYGHNTPYMDFVPDDVPVWGEHSRLALAGAVLVGRELGLTDDEIRAGLMKVHPVHGRMNPLRGHRGALIIDDSYNAQPDAVLAALHAVTHHYTEGKRIAILGTMNELGPEAAKYHEQVGRAAAGLDELVTIGALANDYLGPAAVRAGLDPHKFKPMHSPVAAGLYVKPLLRDGDIVLVKGSQNGVFAEESIKFLLADLTDINQLVRQSPAWMNAKIAQFPEIAREDSYI